MHGRHSVDVQPRARLESLLATARVSAAASKGALMKITAISIKSYAGIKALDAAVPEHGLVISGGNGRGKSSVLKALLAALAGRGIDASAIHNGDDVAEVRVEIVNGSTTHTVKRRITPRQSTLDVSVGEMDAKKPAAFIAGLLGATLDPLELATVDAKRRKALVLAALPVKVTIEQIDAWAPCWRWWQVETDGHGLEVIERLRKAAYDDRTDANREVKALEIDLKRLASEADALATKVPVDGARTVAEAESELAEAQKEVDRLRHQNAESARTAERSASTRERAAKARAAAADYLARAKELMPAEGSVPAATFAAERAAELVMDLARQLEAAKAAWQAALKAREALLGATREVIDLERSAEIMTRGANDLDASIAAVSVAPVEPVVLFGAERRVADATAGVDDARAKAAADAARDRASAAAEMLVKAKSTAEHLDNIVQTLTTTAPQALLASADGIPGLSIVDDDIALDGVRWASLSTSEQMRLALDVARRVSKSNIFFVDRLEAIDEERREEFVRLATANGGQLFATLVTRGEVQLVAVEPSEAAAAAE